MPKLTTYTFGKRSHALTVHIPVEDYQHLRLLALAATTQLQRSVTVSDIVRSLLDGLQGVPYADAGVMLQRILPKGDE